MNALRELKMQPLPTVSGYRTCALLGRGGMGEVYAAMEQQSGRMVAIKILRSDAQSQQAVARFARECRILARFDHPHIARIFGHGLTDHQVPYLAMEYVEGQSILDYCESHELQLEARVKLFHQVCLAVAVAHESRIVHRDLKPANILVTANGVPKLLDFGIATLVDGSTEDLTATGHRLLTPSYASIEQFRGGPVTPASDVYSLAIILNELAFDVRWPDHASHDARLRRVVEKATAERPSERYATAAELAAEIQAYLEGKPVRAAFDRRRRTFARFAAAVGLVAISLSAYALGDDRTTSVSTSDRSYLVARHLWNKLSDRELAKAEQWFRRAVNEDPSSALARAGLADALYFQGEMGALPPRQAYPQAKVEARKAIELKTRLPLGHVVLGGLLAADFKWQEAERELKKALDLDPRSVRALHGYGCFLMRLGRFDEAREVIHRARLLDPASPILGMLEGRISYYARDYDRAARELSAVIDREPGFRLANYFLGLSHGFLRNESQAIQALQSAGLSPTELGSHIAWVKGQNGGSNVAEDTLQAESSGDGAVYLAAQLGRSDIAFAILNDAWKRRLPLMLSLRVDPRFDPLRADPRFSELLERTGGETPQPPPRKPLLTLVSWVRG